MTKMSIEEKAKAYDEALELARAFYIPTEDKEVNSVLEQIFPELRESEDERIRKVLINYFKGSVGLGVALNGVGVKDIVAYLEKQKEQKSTLRTERIRPKFAVGDTVYRPMWSEHTIREIYIRCDDPVYVCVNEEGTESHIPMSEQDEWERREQKPVEWSEEDEKALKIVTDVFKEAGVHLIHYPALLSWLKSLRPQWKPTEKDLMMLEHIIGQYEIGNKNCKTMGYLPRVEELNFLKKILDVWKN